jgi:hypothetical protein
MVVARDLSDGRGMHHSQTARSRAPRPGRYVFPMLTLMLGSAMLLAGASPGIGWALLVVGATLATLALSAPPAATARGRVR